MISAGAFGAEAIRDSGQTQSPLNDLIDQRQQKIATLNIEFVMEVEMGNDFDYADMCLLTVRMLVYHYVVLCWRINVAVMLMLQIASFYGYFSDALDQ